MSFAILATKPSEIVSYLHYLFRSLALTLRLDPSDSFNFYAHATANTWRGNRPHSSEERTFDDKSATAMVTSTGESLVGLPDLQMYAEHYQQVREALAADPTNSELRELKDQLEEILSLAEHLAMTSTTTPQASREPEGESKTRLGTADSTAPLDQPEAGVNFEVQARVMQEQGSVFMVQLSWASGDESSKRAFHELVDHVKHALTIRFPRA